MGIGRKSIIGSAATVAVLVLAGLGGGYFYIKFDKEAEYTRKLDAEVRNLPFVHADFDRVKVWPLRGRLEIEGLTVERDGTPVAAIDEVAISNFDVGGAERRQEYVESVTIEAHGVDVDLIALGRVTGGLSASLLKAGYARFQGDLALSFEHSADAREAGLRIEARLQNIGTSTMAVTLVELDPSVQSELADLRNIGQQLLFGGRRGARNVGRLGEALVPARLAAFELEVEDGGLTRQVLGNAAYEERILVALDEPGFEEVRHRLLKDSPPSDKAPRLLHDLHDRLSEYSLDGGRITISAAPDRAVALFEREDRGPIAVRFREDSENILEELNLSIEVD